MDRTATRDRYRVRTASTSADVAEAQALRHRIFLTNSNAADGCKPLDVDRFDDTCTHFLIEDMDDGTVVATFRVLPLASGSDVDRSYSAQFYDLTSLQSFPAPMAEVGRFGVLSERAHPDILRMAWAALTAFVDRNNVELLFGCSSFEGIDESAYSDAFAMLRDKHLAPRRFCPRVKAPDVFRFAKRLTRMPDRARALRTMPPLLRSYLKMGGWVSDHAVVDREMNTLHVFTGLEVCRIPPARARVLRAAVG